MSFVVHLCTAQRALPCSFPSERQCRGSPCLKAVSPPGRSRLADFPSPLSLYSCPPPPPPPRSPRAERVARSKNIAEIPVPLQRTGSRAAQTLKCTNAPAPRHTLRKPGRERGGRRARFGLSERPGAPRHIPHSGMSKGVRGKGLRFPLFRVRPLRAAVVSPKPGKSLQPIAVFGEKGKSERNAFSSPLPT